MADADPARKRVSPAPIIAWMLVLLLAVAVVVRSFDAILSWAVSARTGSTVAFSGSSFIWPASISFRQAKVELSVSTVLILTEGKVRHEPRAGWTARIERVEGAQGWLDSVISASGSTHAGRIGEFSTLKNSRWLWLQEGGKGLLRLLDGEIGTIRVQGGASFDAGRFRRASVFLRIPHELAELFGGKLSAQYLSSDRLDRRLCKLSLVPGRWSLWGRSGRALEAAWR